MSPELGMARNWELHGKAFNAAKLKTGGYMKKIFLSLIADIAAVLGLSACDSFPLQDAAYKGDVAQVRKLIEKGADVNAARNNGGTALMAASEKGHADIVELLKSRGAKE